MCKTNEDAKCRQSIKRLLKIAVIDETSIRVCVNVCSRAQILHTTTNVVKNHVFFILFPKSVALYFFIIASFFETFYYFI